MPPEKQDVIKKRDLDFILEVNKKSIEIQTEVADQNEETISSLADIRKTQLDQESKLDKLKTLADHIDRELYKMQILYIVGLLTIIGQIIQIFLKK